MKWSNVRLILGREIRDQLRDRRTLFMIAVLPLLLYPLLGMSFFQVTQFLREHPIRVLVIGAPEHAALPPLIEKDHFAPELFTKESAGAAKLLQVTAQPINELSKEAVNNPLELARRDLVEGGYDVVVYFPPEFVPRFDQFHEALLKLPGKTEITPESREKLPAVGVYPNLSQDASKAAYRRVTEVLDRWREEIGRRNLAETSVPFFAAKPFDIATRDVAEAAQHKAALWSKILPFVLLVWALTGAFYPAIDLCAGEKERGTLETLLSSPAERIEIVWGKLLTIMLFSMATAILNLSSLAITGSFILSQMPNLGPPPTLAFVWLLLALVPVSALFAALCLALAAFARSTKEGQYYLMPLILITLPLVTLPMAPGVELNLGNSLIPITGVVLLLRSMLEGNYFSVLPYLPVVVMVTLCCCWLAIRWATDQFNSESVLFRESERWDVGLWFKHLLRDREATPSFSEAMFCGVLILLIKFFMSFSLPAPHSFSDFAKLAAITQIVVIATPALFMTIMLTRSPVQTLLLKRPPVLAALAAGLLAIVLHPAVNLLQVIVTRVYPLNPIVVEELNRMIMQPDSTWVLLLVVAVLPAICEELAFRGFVLSGLRHMGHKWTAIVISSVFFGAAHALFQQSIIACMVGMILGFIAIQTGSILPGILFHIVHNSMAVIVQQFAAGASAEQEWINWIVRDASGNEQMYHWPVIGMSLLLSAAILYWFHRLPYWRTPEESLQEAIDHRSANWMPS